MPGRRAAAAITEALTLTFSPAKVRRMPKRSASLDRIFKALGDPTRRAVVARLCRAPASMTELARPFGMALPSFAQHLDALEACGLVRSSKTGRVRTYRIVPKPLATATHWLDAQRRLWDRRLDQLDAVLHELHKKG